MQKHTQRFLAGVAKLSLLLTAIIFCCTGCLRLSSTVTIDRDGSGSIEIEYNIPEQTIMQIRSMTKLRRELQEASGKTADPQEEYSFRVIQVFFDPTDNGIQTFFNELQDNGISLQSKRIRSREGARQVNMSVNFSSLEKLAASAPFSIFGFSIMPAHEGNYRIIRQGNANINIPEVDMNDPAFVSSVVPFLQGFRAELRVRTPGPVVAANTPAFQGNTAMWTFDFDREPRALHYLNSRDMELVFAAEGVSLPEITQKSEQSRLLQP